MVLDYTQSQAFKEILGMGWGGGGSTGPNFPPYQPPSASLPPSRYLSACGIEGLECFVSCIRDLFNRDQGLDLSGVWAVSEAWALQL